MIQILRRSAAIVNPPVEMTRTVTGYLFASARISPSFVALSSHIYHTDHELIRHSGKLRDPILYHRGIRNIISAASRPAHRPGRTSIQYPANSCFEALSAAPSGISSQIRPQREAMARKASPSRVIRTHAIANEGITREQARSASCFVSRATILAYRGTSGGVELEIGWDGGPTKRKR